MGRNSVAGQRKKMMKLRDYLNNTSEQRERKTLNIRLSAAKNLHLTLLREKP